MVSRPIHARSARRGRVLSLLISFLVMAVGQIRADDDQTPNGMVAFFMTSGAGCPPGWAVATAAQGRLLLGVTDGDSVGASVGTPLAAQTAPLHVHSYQTAVTLDEKKIAAIHCCNNQGAKNGDYTVPDNAPGTTNGGVGETSNLPFIQLVACQKQ